MSKIMTDLKSLIKNNGAISVAEFFNEAMFNAIDGYYTTKKPIGKKGDFITSPEINQVFGELISAYFFNLILASNKKIALVEMGAGNATLFYDVISTIKKLAQKLNKFEEIKSRLSLNIIEISDSLTKIQKEKLAILSKDFCEINWYKNFADFQRNNSDREIYFFANELFDCFPTHQFKKTSQGWQEILVDFIDNKFVFILENFSELKHKMVSKLALAHDINNPQESDIFEHSFKADQLMTEISYAIQTQGGVGLAIDYGYFTSPLKSTFQALKNHEFSNVLENIGESDLTFHVDFKGLERIAKMHSLKTSLISQREFLLSLGIEERRKTLLENSQNKDDINLSIDRLIDPKQMGELFKCLIFWK